MNYDDFIAGKAVTVPPRGLTSAPTLASHLFAFQRACVDFGLRQGSWGLFLDTGLGKTACELEWCRHAADASNGRALILTPLAVARQIEAEGHRWGYAVRVIREMADVQDGINVCNYDRLHLLEPSAFGAVALDESSILKAFTGATTRALIAAFAGHRWRMAATATPAPNDHMELGQHGEFLGLMPSSEMLMRWFIADQTAMGRYRLKHHAVTAFWDWMASWSRMAEHPRDLGDDVDGYNLSPLQIIRHTAEADEPVMPRDGLFASVAVSATDMYAVKRQTAEARAEVTARIVLEGLTCRADETTCAATTPPTRPSGSARQSNSDSATKSDANGTLTTPPTAKSRSARSATPPSATRGSTRKGDSASRSESTGLTTTPSSSSRTAPAESAGRATRDDGASSMLTTATSPAGSAACSVSSATSDSASSWTTRRISSALPITSGRPESWLLWCDTNAEQDAIEAALARHIGPDSFFSIRGSDSTYEKEERVMRWVAGERPIMVSKASILGWGMNFQHCARIVFVGRTFSYEAWYQAVRRCWRFGQTQAVQVHLIVAEAEDAIGRVLDRKSADHQQMKLAMVAAMQRATGLGAALRQTYHPNHHGHLPAWLRSAS